MTRAQTNAGAVMGMDGNREESKITIEKINTEINTTINHRNKYNNQPREEDGESTSERWGRIGTGTFAKYQISIDYNINKE